MVKLEMVLQKEAILFVNMHDINSEIMSDFFIKWGYDVRKVGLGSYDESIIKESNIIAIVFQFIDYSPQEYELFKSILRVCKNKRLVITSPFKSTINQEKLRSMGIVDIIIQPFNPKELLIKIKN